MFGGWWLGCTGRRVFTLLSPFSHCWHLINILFHVMKKSRAHWKCSHGREWGKEEKSVKGGKHAHSAGTVENQDPTATLKDSDCWLFLLRQGFRESQIHLPLTHSSLIDLLRLINKLISIFDSWKLEENGDRLGRGIQKLSWTWKIK